MSHWRTKINTWAAFYIGEHWYLLWGYRWDVYLRAYDIDILLLNKPWKFCQFAKKKKKKKKNILMHVQRIIPVVTGGSWTECSSPTNAWITFVIDRLVTFPKLVTKCTLKKINIKDYDKYWNEYKFLSDRVPFPFCVCIIYKY